MALQNCNNELGNFATSSIHLHQNEQIQNTASQKIVVTTPEVINNLNYLKIVFTKGNNKGIFCDLITFDDIYIYFCCIKI